MNAEGTPASGPPDAAAPKGMAYRRIVLFIYLSTLLIVGVGLRHSLVQLEGDIANIARERGAVLFRLIEITRDWNASHGGVYAPVTELTQPNPSLKHEKRDIVDQDGRRLTMINPAFMTRQIAEIAAQAEGVRFHITSLKPIRPANQADSWETETLNRFEKSALAERLDYFADGGGALREAAHRYMAPLIVKQACLKCHAFQGYRVGDIRGGISISMPAAKLLAIGTERRRQIVLLYLAGGLIVAGLAHLVAWRTRRHLQTLEAINRNQEHIIDARTRDLLDAAREQRLAAVVFDSAAEAIIVTDRANKIVRVNPAFTAITGYTPAEAIGQDPSLLKSGRHEPAFFAEMWRHIDELERWEGEIWNRRKNGEIFAAWLAITTVRDDAEAGRHVATFIDISRRKEAEAVVLQRANFDLLTGLPNRGLFDDRLTSALAAARRHHRHFALFYLDLDRFKAVNDRFGHAAGDALLIESARRMEHCVRESDTVARLGGDEFAVILADLNLPAEVEEVAHRLNRHLVVPFDLSEGTADVSASIGIAIYPQDGEDELLLKKAADQALYAAKAAGRNTYRLASPA